MRLMLADPELSRRGAVVCEDDVLLHDEFAERYDAAIAEPAARGRACASSATCSAAGIGLRLGGARSRAAQPLPDRPRCGLELAHVLDVAGVRRRLLELHGERAPEDLSPIVEHQIQHPSGGFVSYPSLAIQDAIDSTIRPPEDLDFHLSGQAMWDYRDYAACEEGDELSPLAQQDPPPQATVGLCMIVRDEAAVIERCLESVLRADRHLDDLRHRLAWTAPRS